MLNIQRGDKWSISVEVDDEIQIHLCSQLIFNLFAGLYNIIVKLEIPNK